MFVGFFPGEDFVLMNLIFDAGSIPEKNLIKVHRVIQKFSLVSFSALVLHKLSFWLISLRAFNRRPKS